MSQKLYLEALADAKKVTEVAENNAKQAVLSAVLPRIKSLIERELMSDPEDDLLLGDSEPGLDSDVDMLGSDLAPDVNDPAQDVLMPDEEGKVTLDLDSLCPAEDEPKIFDPVLNDEFSEENDEENHYELSLDPFTKLEAKKIKNSSQLIEKMNSIAEAIKQFSKAGKLLRESKGFNFKIMQMIDNVENMYEYVQESKSDSKTKKAFSQKLESYFQTLKKLRETAMSRNRKKMNEDETQMDDLDLDTADADVDAGVDDAESPEGDGELTLKLTGLPDDVELDDVGVDMIVDDEDESGDEGADFDMEVDDQGGDEDEGADFDIDMDNDDEDEGEAVQQMHYEVNKLSDNTVVEIDENMLRREIQKMRKLRESECPDANGQGQDAASLDDFGGASDQCEPLDVDVEADDSAEPLGENDMDLGSDMPMESLRRQIKAEQRYQNRCQRRARTLKTEAKRSRGRRLRSIKNLYSKVASRFAESRRRVKSLNNKLNEVRSNSTSQRADKTAVKNLRRKLAESNLNNVKLVYANKVIQNGSLGRRQKAQAIRNLDSAKTVREAKLVYESVVNTATAPRSGHRTLKENRESGGSSRVTRRTQPSLMNEGFECERWSKLAGITK